LLNVTLPHRNPSSGVPVIVLWHRKHFKYFGMYIACTDKFSPYLVLNWHSIISSHAAGLWE